MTAVTELSEKVNIRMINGKWLMVNAAVYHLPLTIYNLPFPTSFSLEKNPHETSLNQTQQHPRLHDPGGE
jgi:hypothetical protein